MRRLTLTLLIVALSHTTASAQLGRVVRKAAAASTGRAASKAARESSEAAASRLLRETAESSAKIAPKLTQAGLAKLTPDAVKAISRHGADVAEPIIARFGDDGARAIRSLSSGGAHTLSQLSDELASSPHRTQWLDTIAKYGDKATEWLWKRRGSVAVGTAATAVLLKPEAFIASTERVATTAIETTGSQVVRPLIQESGEHLVEPIARSFATSTLLPITAVLCLCGWYLLRDTPLHRILLRALKKGGVNSSQ